MRLNDTLAAAAALFACFTIAQAAPPKVLDDRYALELVATEPEIVTPVGATFDSRGRLLVIESHTHFPPGDYAGPKVDRIRLVEDTNGDGRADRFQTFHEGTRATMSIAAGPHDWIYVATRRDVFRIRDTKGDDVTDERQELIRLETPGNYPHNGLCGLTFDNQGHLYFGLGENLGEPYTLVARDGTRWQGGGEGGNVFRCRVDGSRLERVATGFWNPFGICIDPFGRVFAVDNDPDGRPPCRLLHVVPGGDYGYQFRYGRSGIHPLQAWDGELPGTLPMVAGTGEAPCAVLPYAGQLWVTSWGENRIERFTLLPDGASWRADRDIVVQGDHQFRPVDFAVAPDGSLYFTDWVDRSYPVHGKGRIWRLRSTVTSSPVAEPAPRVAELARVQPSTPEQSPAAWPDLTDAEKQAQQARDKIDRQALVSADPFLRQAAVRGLVQSGKATELAWDSFDRPRSRLGLLEARRWLSDADVALQDGDELLTSALSDPDEAIRLYAIRWVADQRRTKHTPALERQLDSTATSPRVFEATIAALDWLERGQVARDYRKHYDQRLTGTVLDRGKPGSIRATALRLISSESTAISPERLEQIIAERDPALRREAVRVLALRGDEPSRTILARLADDPSLPPQLRADAAMGLAADAGRHGDLLQRLAKDESAIVVREAQRIAAFAAPAPTRDPGHPPADDLDAWLERVGEGGDAESGWRIFFGTAGGRCASCHSLNGRGASIGPDLTRIGSRTGARRVLESILQPSREIAPQYQAFAVELADGRVINGLSLGRFDRDLKERFVGADGREIVVDVPSIEHRVALSTSIMPQGLEQGLSVDDLRDLLALLMNGEKE